MTNNSREYLVNLLRQPTERWHCLCWTQLNGVGWQIYTKLRQLLVDEKLSWQQLWQDAARLLKQAGWAATNAEALVAAIQSFSTEFSPAKYHQWLEQQQVGYLLVDDLSYPLQLAAITEPPLALFYQGNISLISNPQIAVVGARRASPYGLAVTEKIVSELIPNYTIVSGFMVGIDLIAHRAAVSGGGQSIGVLGFGHQRVYPARTWRDRRDFLAANQLIISEYPPLRLPHPGQFVARNRVIAGLAEAVVVAEAAERSGSLITAELGLDFGRTVAAVPGSIFAAGSRGTHQLLRQGALAIGSGQELIAELTT